MIGFDNNAINHQLLVALPFVEMSGTLTYDVAKPHHEMALSGTPPTWHSLASGFPYITLDGGADFLECPGADSADLNFVAGDFSLSAWINIATGLVDYTIMSQGQVDVDGWELYVDTSVWNTFALRTYQAGTHPEISAIGAFTPSTWQLVGVTRSGNSGQFYAQGLPVTTVGIFTNPVSPAGGNRFLVGAHESAGGPLGTFLAGSIALPRIWNRELTEIEWKEIFNVERHWFNV